MGLSSEHGVKPKAQRPFPRLTDPNEGKEVLGLAAIRVMTIPLIHRQGTTPWFTASMHTAACGPWDGIYATVPKCTCNVGSWGKSLGGTESCAQLWGGWVIFYGNTFDLMFLGPFWFL